MAKDIDEYLALLPDEPRNALQDLRGTIRTAAPGALEKIYYRIPTFMYHGPLVGFSASADHGSLHLMSPPLLEAHREELGSYDTTAATIRFPYDDPLPDSLVTMLVKERLAENEKGPRSDVPNPSIVSPVRSRSSRFSYILIHFTRHGLSENASST